MFLTISQKMIRPNEFQSIPNPVAHVDFILFHGNEPLNPRKSRHRGSFSLEPVRFWIWVTFYRIVWMRVTSLKASHWYLCYLVMLRDGGKTGYKRGVERGLNVLQAVSSAKGNLIESIPVDT